MAPIVRSSGHLSFTHVDAKRVLPLWEENICEWYDCICKQLHVQSSQ